VDLDVDDEREVLGGKTPCAVALRQRPAVHGKLRATRSHKENRAA